MDHYTEEKRPGFLSEMVLCLLFRFVTTPKDTQRDRDQTLSREARLQTELRWKVLDKHHKA